MGSEHYCLRWNNHQSNLLGVFSQLLQDESLVDVTLACSEGAPIRAHKVVLSACSSYFQSLFLDHPERHPIVILKDVRFTELQTLVEFMYKGEVNVQYCQLSALLKTAESLKVKGLAEMTNQNTALREPEREPDRLRPHSQPKPSTCDSPLAGSASAHSAANSTSSLHQNSSLSLKREACSAAERCSPSPPKRMQQSSPVPLDLYQRRCPSSGGGVGGGDMSATSTSVSGSGGGAARTSSNINNSNIYSNSNNNNNDDTPHHHLLHHHHHHHQQQLQQQQHHLATSPRDEHDRDRPSSANDDTYSNDQQSIGINMSLNASSATAASAAAATSAASASNSSQQSSTSQSVVVPPVNSSSTSTASSASAATAAASSSTSTVTPSDLTNRPSSRSGGGGIGIDRPSSSGNIPSLPSSALTHTATSSSSGLASPILASVSGGGVPSAGEPLAGPSGLGPVQSVPLSLKKEIDWDRDERTSSGGGGGDLDYRTSHDSETSESPHGGGGGGCGSGGGGGGSVPSLEGTPAPLYPCMYCGATFPHQSKLTRHILSHSLETLKYREGVSHLLHPGHMMPHELPPLSQHFPRQVLPSLEGCLDPQDGSPTTIDMEFAAAAAAAMSSVGGNSSLSIASGGCSSGNGGLGGVGGSSSGLAMGSGGACSSSSSTSNDPNSVVLCKFCGKSFPDVASLITHLPVHTGDRPFKCEFCGKAFKLRHHMKDHCRVHTGERPFRCHMCGKTFSRSTILKAHEKTHFPKYVRKFLSPSPVDTKDELPQ